MALGRITAVAADADVPRLLSEGRKRFDAGDYDAAERAARQAAKTLDRVGDDDVMQRVKVDMLLGRALMARGVFGAARTAFEDGLQRLVEAPEYGPDYPAVSTPLVNLASLFVLTGEFPQAERAARRAVEVNERHPKIGPDHLQTAMALHALAMVHDAQGDLERSAQLLKRVLDIKKQHLEPDSDGIASSLVNLAQTLYMKGDYAAAKPLVDRYLPLIEKLKGPDHPDTALALNNAARLHRAMGRYDLSEQLQRRALAVSERALPADHPLTARYLSNMGELLLGVGRPAEARNLFERSAASRERTLGRSHPLTAISWQNLAFAAAGQGDWDAAVDAAERGRRAVRRHVARVLPALTDREQLQFLKIRDEENLHGVLSIGLARADDAAAAERSAGWLANAKAVGQEASAERAQVEREPTDPAARRTATDLKAVRAELAALRQAVESGNAGDVATRLADLERREEDLVLALGVAVPWREADDPWMGIDAIRKAMPPGSVFVDVARFRPRDFTFAAAEGRRFDPSGEARYAAWVVPPAGRGPVTVVDLGDAARIDALVAAYRRIMDAAAGPQGAILARGEDAAEKELAAAAAPLAKLTIQPLLAAAKRSLGADPEELIVSPDGPLWLVPFAALPLEDGRYAVEALAVRHVTSGRHLVGDRRGAGRDPAAGRRPLIMAAPNFDARSTGPQPAVDERGVSHTPPRRLPLVAPLPGTLEEARAVAPAVGRIATVEPEVVVADEATETRFKRTARPRLAVMATHGFFLPDQRIDRVALAVQRAGEGRGLRDVAGDELENPLTRCGLMLAGCNSVTNDPSGDDGVLTGLEILSCDLRGTKLVMLSACQTGVGDVEAGEGVAGLRQAFQLAGAEAVVSTLWSVPDRETVEISTALFEALAAGETPARATRQAQLAQITARRDRVEAAHPYFWAAFTVTGR